MDQNTTSSESVVPSISSLEEAKTFLNMCIRKELRDHAFGDMEVSWYLNDKEVASGYFGSSQSICIFDPNTNDTKWGCKGRDTYELRNAGTLGEVHRNDETGPDSYQEGRTMPGLTLEGVLKEITGD